MKSRQIVTDADRVADSPADARLTAAAIPPLSGSDHNDIAAGEGGAGAPVWIARRW